MRTASGLCLGFDMPDIHLTPVQYTRKRLEPEVDVLVGGGSPAEAAMLRILATKYSHWRYENEVRAFLALDTKDPDTGLYFFEFAEGISLREVILGHASTLTRVELLDALSDLAPEVVIHEARLAFHSFRVVRQRKKTLWRT